MASISVLSPGVAPGRRIAAIIRRVPSTSSSQMSSTVPVIPYP